MSNKEKKTPHTILRHKVWFTSDTHFGHKNIAKYAPKRAIAGNFDREDIVAHDNWLVDVWNSTVDKHDVVYILGDLYFGNPEEFIKILSKLNGKKYWFLGNHDRKPEILNQYFEMISQQGVLLFKEHNFEFLEEDFRVFVNHFPSFIWDKKQHGCCHAHGHCHGDIDWYNKEIPDLRVDVGIDSELGDCGLVSLEKLYRCFKEKTGGLLFVDYIKKNKNILI